MGAVARRASEIIGLSVKEIRQRYFAGESLTDMAEERHVDRDALINELAATATEHIHAAVADRTTAAERDALSKLVQVRVGRLVTHVVRSRLSEDARRLGSTLAKVGWRARS